MKLKNKTRKKLLTILLIIISVTSFYIGKVVASPGITPTVLEEGSLTETANYVIFIDDSTVYAKNGRTGAIEFTGTDASTVIQSAINALPTYGGGKIFIYSGYYNIKTPIIIQDKNGVFLEGIGPTERSMGTSFYTSILDNQYFIEFKAQNANVWGGGIKGIQFYNTDMNKNVYGIRLQASTYYIEYTKLSDILASYLKRGITLDGYVWDNQFSNIQLVSYSSAFQGDYALKLEKTNTQSYFWNAPKRNNFENLHFRLEGNWSDIIQINHARANYNYFANIYVCCGKINRSVIYTTGASNQFHNFQMIDAFKTNFFEAGILTEKKDYPYDIGFGPLPGEVAYGGFGNQFDLIRIALSPDVKFKGGAFKNQVELLVFGVQDLTINATDGGADNKVILSNAIHLLESSDISLNVLGNVELEGYKIEDNGNATIPQGLTSITVSHDLVSTPAVVIITPNKDTRFWITDKTATQFTINIPLSVTGGVSFDWYAKV